MIIIQIKICSIFFKASILTSKAECVFYTSSFRFSRGGCVATIDEAWHCDVLPHGWMERADRCGKISEYITIWFPNELFLWYVFFGLIIGVIGCGWSLIFVSSIWIPFFILTSVTSLIIAAITT